MPLAPNFVNPTGKQNALESFRSWLSINVPGTGVWTWMMTPQQAASIFPRIEITEFQLPGQGASAYGNNVFPANLGIGQTLGHENEFMVQFDLFTEIDPNDPTTANAYQLLYYMRDQIVFALDNAGMVSDVDDSTIIMPAIEVYDWSQNPVVDTNTVIRTFSEIQSPRIEQYFSPTQETPNVHQLRILKKLGWWELSI